MPSKFNNKKISTEEGIFDSKKEHKRFLELKKLEACGSIENLQRQVEFELLPSQKISTGTLRAVKYIADFVYIKDGQTIIEDVKPTSKGQISKSYKNTSAWHEYMIKKKLMKFIKNIEIKEI